MPFIHVRSLPFKQALDLSPVVEGISRDFARDARIALEHVAVTWAFLPEGGYAVAGQASHHQPRASHPVLVDVLAPDFNDPETIAHMMRALAQSIAVHAGVKATNVFINYREVHAGQVFDTGEVIRWKQGTEPTMFRTLITALTLLHLGPGIAFAVLAFGCDPADPVAGVLCRQDTIGAFVGITLGVWGVYLVGLGVMWLRRRLRSPSAGESAGGPPRAKA